MYGNTRIHGALAIGGLFAAITATMATCALEDPALYAEAEDSALLAEAALDGEAVLTAPESAAAALAEPMLDPAAGIALSEPFWVFAKHSGKALDVAGASKANSAQIIQYDHHGGENQVFFVEPVGGGHYRIVALHSGKVLDVAGASNSNGAKIIQYEWHGGDNQRFRFEHVGAGYYKIIAKHSDKVLDVNGASNANGAHVIQWAWNGGDNQKWRISPIIP